MATPQITAVATSSLEKIKKLESPTGWPEWYRQIQNWLAMNGFKDLLSRNADEPLQGDLTALEYRTIKEQWLNKQERACAMVANRCGWNALKELEKLEEDKVTQHLAVLKKRYQPTGSAVFKLAIHEYFALSVDDCVGISDFAEKLRKARSELEALDKDCAISEPFFVERFLSGLGPVFSVFLTSFYQTHDLLPTRNDLGEITKASVTFDEAVMAAEREEQAQKLGEKNGIVMMSHKPAQRARRQCSNCGRMGHLPDTCYKLHPELRPDSRKKRDSNKRQRKEEEDGENGEPNGMNALAMAPALWEPPSGIGHASFVSADFPAVFSAGSSEQAKYLRMNWILDSGCNQHTSPVKEFFDPASLRPYSGKPIQGLSATSTPEMVGTARIPCQVNRKIVWLTLKDTLYHPQAACNIISYSQLKRNGADIRTTLGGFEIGTAAGTIAVDERHGLFFLRLWRNSDLWKEAFGISLPAYAVTEAWLGPWHERMGHLGEDNLKKLAHMSTGMRPLPEACLCIACIKARLKETPHNKSFRPGSYPLEFIHVDIAGPMAIKGHGGAAYWVTMVDDKTGITKVTPIRTKDELSKAVFSWLDCVERPERRCHRIRLDQAGENTSTEFINGCKSRGIELEFTATDQHQQNGVAEVTNRLILERTHATLAASGLPLYCWPFVVEATAYLRNRSPHAKTGTTPYEAWWGDKPDLAHIRKIGTHCFAKVTSRRRKLADDKSTPCQLLGFEGSRIYILLRHDGVIIRSSNVVFNEHFDSVKPQHLAEKVAPEMSREPLHLAEKVASEVSRQPQMKPTHLAEKVAQGARKRPQNEPVPPAKRVGKPPSPAQRWTTTTWTPLRRPAALPHALPVRQTSGGEEDENWAWTPDILPPQPLGLPPDILPSQPLGLPPDADSVSDQDSVQINTPSSDTIEEATPDHERLEEHHPELVRTSARSNKGEYSLHNPQRYGFNLDDDFNLDGRYNLVFALIGAIHMASDACEPRSYREAQRDPQWSRWVKAMKEELHSLHSNKTWILVPRPGNRRVLGGKWVYKLKTGPNGEILRYKARWVVQGFRQEQGIDYNETFASVVKPMSYKALFAIAAALDLEIHQMDVKTAFLYGTVEEEIYVEQPDEPGKDLGQVCRLNKALYGLKQSPRIWYTTIASFLASLGFKPLHADLGVFVKGQVFMAIYVDDLLIAGPSLDEIAELKTALSRKFEMSDLGECHYYLGMEVRRDRRNRSIRLGQRAYTQKILGEFGLKDASTTATPMDTTRPVPAPEGHKANPEVTHWFQKAIGSLMYLMLGTRPDIAFAVSCLSRFMANPTNAHCTAIKRVFRYLQGTIDLELVFKGPLRSLQGFTDADWAGDTETRRSTSGYLFNVGSGALSWSSKRQPTVALSSCEAEYMGQTQAAKEAIWLQGLLKELLKHEGEPMATVIFGDNQGALALAKNPQFHARTKHIDTQWHFVREQQAKGTIELQYVPTGEQVADGLTKPLPKPAFLQFRRALGLESRA